MFTQRKVTDTRTENGCVVGTADNGALAIDAPNLNAFLDHVKIAYPHTKQEGASNKSNKDYGYSGSRNFFHFDSFDQAQDVFINRPWEVVNFQEVDTALKSPDNAGGDVFFDVTGDFLDVGRLLDGEPEHFGNAYLGNPRGLFITIYANISSSYTISAPALVRKQQRIVALIDWLESNQIRTKFTGISNSGCEYVEVTLKDFHEPLNLNPIGVAFNPDFLRRMIFRVDEWSPTWQYGYGTSVTPLKVDEKGLSIGIPSNQGEAAAVDKYFDKLIVDIEKRIEEGDLFGTLGGIE